MPSFLDEIALGRYIAGSSPLHKARADSKAFFFFLVALLIFLFKTATSFLVVGLVLAVLTYLSGVPQKLYWRSLRPVNLLALFTILAGAYLNHGQSSFSRLVFTWEGLHSGGLYAGRLVLITLLTTLFLLTTRADRTVALGIRLLAPLRLIGMEQRELSLLAHLAYRFVPLLRREIKEMELGRRARNLPAPNGWGQKMREGSQRIIHLFVGALQRAETTSFSLEQRRILDHWKPTASAQKGLWIDSMSVTLLLLTIACWWGEPYLL